MRLRGRPALRLMSSPPNPSMRLGIFLETIVLGVAGSFCLQNSRTFRASSQGPPNPHERSLSIPVHTQGRRVFCVTS
jgi:hypothetical protein